ncbi:30615_t:CDS:2, partial [Gigaspora margarita]
IKRLTGFGFVNYTSSEEADRAKLTMHGKILGTKQIVVRLYEPKKLHEAKLANQDNCSPTSPSESCALSRSSKRSKHIPSVPTEEVNPTIEYLLSIKTPEILHILKDATLQQKITEMRSNLLLEKKHRSTEEAPSVTTSINSSSNVQALSSQMPQRKKFFKAIKKLCTCNFEEFSILS